MTDAIEVEDKGPETILELADVSIFQKESLVLNDVSLEVEKR